MSVCNMTIIFLLLLAMSMKAGNWKWHVGYVIPGRSQGNGQSTSLLSGDSGDSAVQSACLTIQVLGLELQVESLPC